MNRESAADAVLAQALEGVNYPAVIESAYDHGVRLFLEMGPGSSCSRMIANILGDRPHLARSACFPSQEPGSVLLRLLASLIAERVEVDLTPLRTVAMPTIGTPDGTVVRVTSGGTIFAPPLPPQRPQPAPAVTAHAVAASVSLPVQTTATATTVSASPVDQLLHDFAAAQEARLQAHGAFLSTSTALTDAMARALALQLSLQAALGDELPAEPLQLQTSAPTTPCPAPCTPAITSEMVAALAGRGSLAAWPA